MFIIIQNKGKYEIIAFNAVNFHLDKVVKPNSRVVVNCHNKNLTRVMLIIGHSMIKS